MVGDGSDDELQEQHELTPAPVPADGFEFERIVLIELERKLKESRRQEVVRQLGARKEQIVRGPSKVPLELIREAVRQGATGRSLALWIAAAAAAGVVALRFGPGASEQIPKVVRSVRNMAGVSNAFPRGGGPRTFNAARALELILVQRRPFGKGGGGGVGSGGGFGFFGTEG